MAICFGMPVQARPIRCLTKLASWAPSVGRWRPVFKIGADFSCPPMLGVRGTRSSLRRFPSEASGIQEESMKSKIGTITLGAAMALGIMTGAWAQSSGAGGTGGGAAGGGVGGNTMGGSTGGRVTAPTPNVNPSTPNTVPQSPQTPVSPGTQTGPGSGTH
jgi:hypothetical protein